MVAMLVIEWVSFTAPILSYPTLSYPSYPLHPSIYLLDADTSTTLHKNDFDSDSLDSADVDGDHRARKRRNKQAWDDGLCSAPLEQPLPDSKVKIALSLYKVQQNIYLLDFQRVEVKESISQTAVEVSQPYRASIISH